MRTVLRRLTARAADRLPEARWRELAALRSKLGDGPRIVTPKARRALVIAPHPDDEILVCGGTVARLTDAGARVTVLLTTSGDASLTDLPRSEIAVRREAEALAACAAIGVHDVRPLRLPDGELAGEQAQLRAAFEAVVDATEPDLVLLPWFGDGHRDHQAVNTALATVTLPDDLPIWGGETWTPAPLTVLVDITDAVERKRAALREHVTAARAFDLEAMLALDRYRSVHGLRGRGYAEGFCALTAAEHRRAVGRWHGEAVRAGPGPRA